MHSDKKITLTILAHPFSSKRDDSFVAPVSFRELFETHVETVLPIEHALIYDNDKRIFPKDYDNTPQSEQVIIRMLPAGQPETLQETGTANKIGGALLTVLGVILCFTIVAPIGVALIGAGVGLFLSGVILYNVEIPDLASRDSPEQLPSIQGARNQTRNNGMIPILLGKHLIAPDNAALPYTTIEGNNQYVHQLFCCGYKDIEIDIDSIKFGEADIDQYPEVTPIEKQIRQGDSAVHDVYPVRVAETSVGLELKDVDSGEGISRAIYKTTNTNTYAIDIDFSFPSGLVRYNDDGNPVTTSGTISIGIAPYDFVEETPTYESYKIIHHASYSGAEAKTKRFSFHYDLDNDSESGSEYNDKRQYLIRVMNLSNYGGAKTSTKITRMNWENFKSYTAAYNSDGTKNTRPIIADVQADLFTFGLKIRASDSLKGVVDQLTLIGQLHTLDYTGTGTGLSSWVERATCNPASMFLYILMNTRINPHPVSESGINWKSIEIWHKFCEEKNFECNAVLNGDITIQKMLTSICSTGRANWLPIDGQFTIVVDTIQPVIKQMFTPRNSKDYAGNKTFADNPKLLKMQYIDALAGYVPAEREVFLDDDDPTNDSSDKSQSVNLFGVTDADHAWKIGKFMLGMTRLRPNTHTFTVDLEHLVCQRGDRISHMHDAALIGLHSGRVIALQDNVSSHIVSFTSDEFLNYEEGKTYTVKIRTAEGTIINKDVKNLACFTDTVEFDTPITQTDEISISDLFAFGEKNMEVLDLLIVGITPMVNMQATLSCVEYAPDLFEVDSGVIPPYNSMISVPGKNISSGGLSIDEVYDPKQQMIDLSTASAINAGIVDSLVGSALTANRDDAFSLKKSAMELCMLDNGEIVYVDMDTFFLYRARKTDTFAGTQITSIPASNPCRAGQTETGVSLLLYVNILDDDRIYIKQTNNASAGTPVTTTAGYKPAYLGNDEFLYLNIDGKLVRGNTTTTTDGSIVTTFGIHDFAPLNDLEIIYANINDDSTLYVKSSVGDDVGVKVGTVASSEVCFDDSVCAYINYDDEYNAYFRDPSKAGEDGDPVFANALSLDVNYNEDLVFVSNDDESNMYSGLKNTSVKGFLKASANEFYIMGDVALGSKRISTLTKDAIQSLVKGDNVYHDSLPTDSMILFVGNDYVILNNPANLTYTQASIQVAGSRLVLDASEVLVPGSVTTSLLKTDAIKSQQVDDNGNPISQLDLATGKQLYRKKDGTTVLDFDAERDGSELLLNGTFVIGSGSTGPDGKSLPTQSDVDALSASLQNQVDGKITMTSSATAPSNPDKDDLWQDTSGAYKILKVYNGTGWDHADPYAEMAFNAAESAGALATEAESKADSALSTASTAKSTADSAISTADTAKSTADSASSSASSALTKADSAVSTAGTAESKATDAQTQASSAVSSASSANSKAETAESIANGAVSTANGAVSTANTAKSTADGAQSLASTANSKAETAQGTADDAVSTASTAKSTADDASVAASSANTQAINAQGTAETAVINASTAQSTATRKAVVFAPSPDPSDYEVNDLWLRTVNGKTCLYKSSADGASFVEGHWTKCETDSVGEDRIADESINTAKLQSGKVSLQSIDFENTTLIKEGWAIYENGDVIFNRGTFRGDLEIGTDEMHRHIQVGSKGLLVTDKESNTIHDLPNAPISTMGYMGHLYYLGSHPEKVYTQTFIATTGGVTIISAGDKVTLDLTEYLEGNTNLKGVMLQVFLCSSINKANRSDASSLGGSLYFYPSSSSYSPVIHTELTGSINAPYTTSDSCLGISGSQSVIVPIFINDGKPSICFAPRITGLGLVYTSVSYEAELLYSISIVGFYG